MRLLALVLCLATLAEASALGAPQSTARVNATLAAVAWLEGAWTSGSVGSHLEERWTSPAGGAMLAVSRTIAKDRMVAFEYLRIVERDETLVFIAQPNGRPPVEFVLTRIERESAVFENPAHDFPKVIRYMKRQDGTLEATVSGAGREKAQSFLFRAQK